MDFHGGIKTGALFHELSKEIDMGSKFLTEKEVSEMTNFSLSMLRQHRHLGKGMPYCKIGNSIRYNYQKVLDFMQAHEITPRNSVTGVGHG